MERKIGETFELEGTTLRVTEINEHSCKGCYLMEECYREKREVTGECFDRTDKKDVIFTEIKDTPEKPEPQEEQELNLLEKLKYCPRDAQLFSPMLGDVLFKSLTDGVVSVYQPQMDSYFRFQPDGTRFWGAGLKTVECMLFPSREQRDWSKVEYKPTIDTLPRSWQEFCETHEVQEGEAYIKDISTVYKAEHTGDTRDMNADKNILPNEQACLQHLALMQLHQLRDCWRDGWKPKENNEKWGITKDIQGNIEVDNYSSSIFLSFQDEERAELFVKHFRNIIMAAGDLI